MAQAEGAFQERGATVQNVSISAGDRVALLAWNLKPEHPNREAVILLHGVGDNRLGMAGYAELLLSHGFDVLMPDSRAHGASGGNLATYGLLERDDVRRWFEWLKTNFQPHCIFGLGESMGAAILLQTMEAEPGFCAVIAESPFATFREIGYDRVGQYTHMGTFVGRYVLRPIVETAFLYVGWKYGLDMDAVSPEDAVGHSLAPVLLIHGSNDSNIPLRHSRRIKAKNPRAVLWEVPRADHCGAVSVAPGEFAARVLMWFSQPARGKLQ